MNVLVSNHSLVSLGGSETFTYTLIGELLDLGFNVEYYCKDKGELSTRIEKDYGISFCSKKSYDLIFANHQTTVNDIYKKGPTIQTCHGIYPSLEQPSINAFGHVAISKEVQKHLLKNGFNSLVISNGINCERYKVINPLRKSRPRVLSLCHSIEAHELVKGACEMNDFDFSSLDKYKDRQWDVEKIINDSDLVVGLGRSAYEALACGRPVVIYDKRHYSESGGIGDGYFLNVMPESIKNNCSGRAFKIPFSKEELSDELKKYHWSHGEIAREYALASFNIKKTVQEYLEYYSLLKSYNKQNRYSIKFSKKSAIIMKTVKRKIKDAIRKAISF